MGNSQTKETRTSLGQSSRRHHASSVPHSHGRSPYGHHYGENASRPDLTFLGIGASSERHVATLEHRRETKQEREARRLEKERVARVKERERSMKEEHCDGGYLVTQGVYVGTEDFNKAMVRRLMVRFPFSTTPVLSENANSSLTLFIRLKDALPHFGGASTISRHLGLNTNLLRLLGACRSRRQMRFLLSWSISSRRRTRSSWNSLLCRSLPDRTPTTLTAPSLQLPSNLLLAPRALPCSGAGRKHSRP